MFDGLLTIDLNAQEEESDLTIEWKDAIQRRRLELANG